MASHKITPVELEESHVHRVYESIAEHFSSTRYKPWPIVARFVDALPPFSLLLDAGCGNGKNIQRDSNSNVFTVGSDRSVNLVAIAAKKNEVYVGDTLCLPHRTGQFDAVMSIAVIHHLATAERRLMAVRELLRVGAGGRVLLYVWALEGNARVAKVCGEGYADAGPDVMVPWKQGQHQGGEASNGSGNSSLDRFYHLFANGELEELVELAGGRVLEHGSDQTNYWAVCT